MKSDRKGLLHRYFLIPLMAALGLAIGLWSCNPDELNSDPQFRLSFSSDTVIFDTVFTSLGSSARALVVKNESDGRISIASVKLARGSSSPFRINIDGFAQLSFANLEIAARDSAYIFVKVTIDPNRQDQPLIETDSILFSVNGTQQNVKLVAWGQDAYFHHNETLHGTVNLPGNKPHVIYGTLSAADGCKLTLSAGTRMYFHNSSSLEIRKGATLLVEGTRDAPVTFTHDRIEKDYRDVPGLWDGIWLENGSTGNRLVYAEIRNPKVGLQADSSGMDGGEPLVLHNCLIDNTLNYGLHATHARVVATNCQITNCGANMLAIDNGGSYDFRNCTFANYWAWSRRFPGVAISNYQAGSTSDLTQAYFGNCIITGTYENELSLDKSANGAFAFNPVFEKCLVKFTPAAAEKTYFTDCIFNQDARFRAPGKYNFMLDTLSPAKDAGSLSIVSSALNDISLDRAGISRLQDGKPDLGAYERVEKARK